jgi:Bacterial PH domain
VPALAAATESVPPATGSPLPRTLRPKWARRVIYPLAVLILAGFVAGVLTLPRGEGGYQVADRVAIFAVGLAMVWFLHRLADVRIRCDQRGVTVVNIFRSRRLEWAQILGVRLDPAAPWLTLDLSDGTTLAAMGVQGSDGEHARRDARELSRLVAEQSRTERDD